LLAPLSGRRSTTRRTDA